MVHRVSKNGIEQEVSGLEELHLIYRSNTPDGENPQKLTGNNRQLARWIGVLYSPSFQTHRGMNQNANKSNKLIVHSHIF